MEFDRGGWLSRIGWCQRKARTKERVLTCGQAEAFNRLLKLDEQEHEDE